MGRKLKQPTSLTEVQIEQDGELDMRIFILLGNFVAYWTFGPECSRRTYRNKREFNVKAPRCAQQGDRSPSRHSVLQCV
jgi:hypothetical protein